MKQFIYWLALLSSLTAFADLPSSIKAPSIPIVDLMTNASFEAGKAGWTTSGASGYVFSINTSTPLNGAASGSFLPSASGQVLSTAQYTVKIGLQGASCAGSILYKSAEATNLYTLQVVNGSSTVLQSVQLPTASSVAQRYAVYFTCPASGTVALQVVSSGSAAAILLDDVTLGSYLPQSSASSGSKNYLSSVVASTNGGIANPGNGNFENGSIFGWSLAHSALSGVFPSSTASAGSGFSSSVGGSAASGNLSLGIISSSQLGGNYSASLASSAASTPGDMLISKPFYIDLSDQARVLSFKFSYKANSGAANLNFSGTASNTHAVWIYDVTNGAWIQPAGVYNLVQGSGVGIATGTFQTPSNSTQFQIALVNVNASGGAFGLYLDDFSVGPQTSVSAPAMSDLQTYTLTIGGVSSAPTPATSAVSSAQWRRVGDSMEIQYVYSQSSATGAANGSGIYLFPLPSGASIDTSKIIVGTNAIGATQNQVGTGSVSNTAAATAQNATHALVFAYNSTNLYLVSPPTTASELLPVSSSSYQLSAAPTYYSFFAKVPIVGWSSNTVMSADTDTRVVAALYNNPGGQAINNTVTAYLDFPTKVQDTHGMYQAPVGTYSASTGTWSTSAPQWNIPVTGTYRIVVNEMTANAGTSGFAIMGISKNGSNIYQQELESTSTRLSGFAVFDYPFTTGDYVQATWANVTGSAFGTSASGVRANISIERISGPATIAASESVSASYVSSETTSITATGTTVLCSNGSSTCVKDWDSHTAFNPASGVYTVFSPGKYRITAGAQLAIVSGNQGNMAIYFEQNGTAKKTIAYDWGSAGAVSPSVSGSALVNCLYGDQLKAVIWQANAASSAIALSGGTGNSTVNAQFVQFERVGN